METAAAHPFRQALHALVHLGGCVVGPGNIERLAVPPEVEGFATGSDINVAQDTLGRGKVAMWLEPDRSRPGRELVQQFARVDGSDRLQG